MPKIKNYVSPEAALVAVTALWGASFILLSIALKGLSPALLVTIRFFGGALIMAAILRSSLFTLTRKDCIAGAVTGFFIFLGYFLQTVGLQTIPSSISAFLTALYVPFVPLFQWIFLKKAPSRIISCGIALAFFGMLLILDPRTLSFSGSMGEWLTIASAAACAMEIIVIAHFARDCDPKVFCFTQLLTVGLLSALYCIGFEEIRFEPTAVTWLCVAVLIGMIAFNQYAISWAQKTVSPVKAVLIYTLEPVFAGIIGWAAGEKLSALALIGAALVIASILMSSLLPDFLKKRSRLSDGEESV